MNILYTDFKNKAFALYFYKGTTFPTFRSFDKNEKSQKNISFMKTQAKEMIKRGFQNGIDIDTQKKDYVEQLDRIEKALYKYCNPTTKKGLEKVSKVLKCDEESMAILWILNIEALIILKHIKNDEYNGRIVYDLTNGNNIVIMT